MPKVDAPNLPPTAKPGYEPPPDLEALHYGSGLSSVLCGARYYEYPTLRETMVGTLVTCKRCIKAMKHTGRL